MSPMHEHDEAAALRTLASPTRNRYFYGKLLDARHLRLEQDYANLARWRMNRLSLGMGVLCGLQLTGGPDGKARIEPGVAIDGLGREIIVPTPTAPFDPLQPSEAAPPATSIDNVPGANDTTVYLCYHECCVEPAPVLVTDECEPERRCEHGLVRERYAIVVKREPWDPPQHPVQAICADLFGNPDTPRLDRLRLLCGKLRGTCDPPEDVCVPIARVTTGENGVWVATCPPPRLLFSNDTLFEMILCLAERCCDHHETPPPPTDFPHVVALVPEPGSAYDPTRVGSPQLDWTHLENWKVTIGFDDPMKEEHLKAGRDAWLRVFLAQAAADQSVGVIRMDLGDPTIEPGGKRATYPIVCAAAPPFTSDMGSNVSKMCGTGHVREYLLRQGPARIVVLARAGDHDIENATGALLRADNSPAWPNFGNVRDTLWGLAKGADARFTSMADILPAPPPGTLPSTDDASAVTWFRAGFDLQPVQVEVPRIMTMSPRPGSAYSRHDVAALGADWTSMDNWKISFTFNRPMSQEQLGEGKWLRLYFGMRGTNQTHGMDEVIRMALGKATRVSDTSAEYPIQCPSQFSGPTTRIRQEIARVCANPIHSTGSLFEFGFRVIVLVHAFESGGTFTIQDQEGTLLNADDQAVWPNVDVVRANLWGWPVGRTDRFQPAERYVPVTIPTCTLPTVDAAATDTWFAAAFDLTTG